MVRFRHFIDGAYVDHVPGSAFAGRTFDNVDPATGAVVGSVCEGGPDEIDAAVTAARRALDGEWGRLPVHERFDRLRAVSEGIERRFDDFLAAEVADTGKPHDTARRIDIPRGGANFAAFARDLANIPDELFHSPTADGRGALNYTIRVPKGVVGVITPWNLPLLLLTWKVAPAMACGNAVVCKPSEETPGTASLLGEVMNEAGIPPGVFNVVHGKGAGSAGAALTAHPGVDAITFTGETATGATIQKAVADRLVDCSFELGGKNPSVVFADADVDEAVAGTLRSVFTNCGQVCLTTERVYVERPIYARFVAALKAGAEALRVGDPAAPTTTLGPLISAEHLRKVTSYFELARQEGATVVTGGGRPTPPAGFEGGHWVQPTIWTGLPDDARTNREEIFGPVCHISPFDTEEEAIARANDTRYGLAAALWTRDVQRAHRVGQALEAGIVWVNTWYLRDLRTAFGGMKASGIGREGGRYSLDFYTEIKNLCIKL